MTSGDRFDHPSPIDYASILGKLFPACKSSCVDLTMVQSTDTKTQTDFAVPSTNVNDVTELKRKVTPTGDDLDDDEPRIEAQVVGSIAPPAKDVEAGPADAASLETTYPEGGYGYVVVFACILVGACTAGSVSALGIYQAEYAERFPDRSSFEVNLIGGFMGFVGTARNILAWQSSDRHPSVPRHRNRHLWQNRGSIASCLLFFLDPSISLTSRCSQRA